MLTIFDRIFVVMQYFLPARLIGAFVHRLARSRRTRLKNTLIRSFTYLFAINTDEMDAAQAIDYPSLNALFTRALKPGARPIDTDPLGICSPADGTVQQAGQVAAGRIFQAKGTSFSAARLLGTEPVDIRPFDDGAYLTIYLAPHNYHRIHAPLDGTLQRMHFIPGTRFSVNRATANSIPGLFARNERLACLFNGKLGPYWLVFVGAMNVASISTAWAGEIVSNGEPRHEVFGAETAPAFNKGDYLGHFNLGSTIIVIFPADTATWDPSLQPQSPVTVGRRIGLL
ncbi:MAG: archaetidylserine decarboxylase [Gammaproteobacteria bacterium]|jgi:phosphatidylserine decarboxylase|nr:phosphatidylserine decarboxylase [Chromatiales bacterium]MCP4927058.1 phosphatidylserine decarboxylase [Gammaproteobacteria bacterium]MDP7153386.1 archaetidylserine decarboxylase [Gammaproteobacteria bacterium]MDP7418514.1 archaetidylserine decarboxylase [Gammaproteobacteria bacterium]MDP7661130.1 archaetidylserine decarboxylase [Gammaproteobacteria bacterium]